MAHEIRDYEIADAEAILAGLLVRERRQGRFPELYVSPDDLAAGAQIELEVITANEASHAEPVVIVRERRDPRRGAIRRILLDAGGDDPGLDAVVDRILEELDR